jgi:hypothetical protein
VAFPCTRDLLTRGAGEQLGGSSDRRREGPPRTTAADGIVVKVAYLCDGWLILQFGATPGEQTLVARTSGASSTSRWTHLRGWWASLVERKSDNETLTSPVTPVASRAIYAGAGGRRCAVAPTAALPSVPLGSLESWSRMSRTAFDRTRHGHNRSYSGGVAEWFRQRSARPSRQVRFLLPPLEPRLGRIRFPNGPSRRRGSANVVSTCGPRSVFPFL